MQIIIFPDGQRVFVNSIKSYQVFGRVLVITKLNGEVINYNIQGSIDTLLTTVDTFITSTNTLLTIVDNAPLSITGISNAVNGSNVFDITTDTVILEGTGFINGSVYNIYFDDVSGGTDYDGYYMVCSYIDSTHLSATFGGIGIYSILEPQVLITYGNPSIPVLSNTLVGSNPAGTIISYP